MMPLNKLLLSLLIPWVLIACTPDNAQQNKTAAEPITTGEGVDAQLPAVTQSETLYQPVANPEEISQLTKDAMNAIEDYYNQHQSWPGSNQQIGLPEADTLKSFTIKSVAISPQKNGQLIITFNDKLRDNATLIFTPNSEELNQYAIIRWDCEQGTLPLENRPERCRTPQTPSVEDELILAASVKAAVAEYYAANGQWPVSNEQARLAPADQINGKLVDFVTVAPDQSGKVIITFNRKLDNHTLILTPDHHNGTAITWDCFGGTLPAKDRPAACKATP